VSRALRELVTFGLVGVVNTCVGLGTIVLMQTVIGHDPLVANPIGDAAGLVNSFLMNRAFTFRDGDRGARSALRFLMAFAVAYAANFLTLAVLIAAEPAWPLLWQVVAMVVYTLVFFVLAKWFVFRVRLS
jgi:putative flippase GtrA